MIRIVTAVAALAAFTLPLAAAPVAVRTIGSATLHNIPDIPVDVQEAVQRYQNSRAALFQDWLPDGSLLIATRFGATQQIHHVAAPGAARRQISFGSEPVAHAHVVPGTDRLVMSQDRGGDEWFQLYLRGMAGVSRQITEPRTRNQSPIFSKDGSLLVWAQAQSGKGVYSLFAIDPGNPTPPRLIHQAEGAITPADISADRQRLIFVRNLSNREQQLFELDLVTGRTKRIAPHAGPAVYEKPRYLPGGKRLLVISERGSDHRQLVEIDIATARFTPLTPGLGWDVEDYDLSEDGRLLAYAVNEGGLSRVVLQDRVARRALPQPELPKGVLDALRFSPDARQLAIGLSSATSPGDVWSWDIQAAKLVRWTDSELGDLDPAQLAEPALIRFRSFDGLSVPAFVYRPKGVAAGEATPVIIDIHGGPEAQTRPSWNYGAQYFADALKATVILPNVRGSDGYGKRYLNLDNAEKREDSVRDIGALLDWIATQPGLDHQRVAVYGQSYGGYMSLAAMVHYSDRLVGGVERYGISNWVSFLENTEAYRRDNRRAEYGDEREPRMRALLGRISPMSNIAHIRKPMLIMQGANDPRVPQSESDQVVAALQANDVETWYVLFADEGHGFHKKQNNDLRREVETIFLRRLFADQPR